MPTSENKINTSIVGTETKTTFNASSQNLQVCRLRQMIRGLHEALLIFLCSNMADILLAVVLALIATRVMLQNDYAQHCHTSLIWST